MEPESSATIAVDGARIAYRRIGKEHRGVDLNSDALPFGRLWYAEPNKLTNAIGYAMHCNRSHDAVISIYDDAGNSKSTRDDF